MLFRHSDRKFKKKGKNSATEKNSAYICSTLISIISKENLHHSVYIEFTVFTSDLTKFWLLSIEYNGSNWSRASPLSRCGALRLIFKAPNRCFQLISSHGISCLAGAPSYSTTRSDTCQSVKGIRFLP